MLKTIKKDIFFKESTNLISNDISIDNFKIDLFYFQTKIIFRIWCVILTNVPPRNTKLPRRNEWVWFFLSFAAVGNMPGGIKLFF